MQCFLFVVILQVVIKLVLKFGKFAAFFFGREDNFFLPIINRRLRNFYFILIESCRLELLAIVFKFLQCLLHLGDCSAIIALISQTNCKVGREFG